MAGNNKDKLEQQKAEAGKLIEELRKIYDSLDDYARGELHKALMDGYCPTCAHVVSRHGQCWNCFESHCDA